MKDRTQPQTSQNVDIVLLAEVVNALKRDISRSEFLELIFPAVMEWMEEGTGGIVNQVSGRWSREIWIGEQEEVPELLIGEALDLGTIQSADGWFVAPMIETGQTDEVEIVGLQNGAPLVAALSGTWSTTLYAEPEGDFEYVYTLSLGERHDEVQDITPLSSTSRVANDLGRRMPYIESPPSPIRTLEQGAASGNNIVVSTSNFPNLIGFGDVSTPRYRRVGIKANLYRRRIKTYGGSLWPSSEHFQHIDTQSFLANGVVFFTDDGETVPGRRLRRSGGYKTLRFSHAPDKPYRLSVRAAIRPFEMKDDADACEVPPGAIDTLISLSLRYLYEASGNPSMAAAAFSDYEVALHALKRRHADIRPPGQTRKIRLRGRRRKGRLYNYTTSAE